MLLPLGYDLMCGSAQFRLRFVSRRTTSAGTKRLHAVRSAISSRPAAAEDRRRRNYHNFERSGGTRAPQMHSPRPPKQFSLRAKTFRGATEASFIVCGGARCVRVQPSSLPNARITCRRASSVRPLLLAEKRTSKRAHSRTSEEAQIAGQRGESAAHSAQKSPK